MYIGKDRRGKCLTLELPVEDGNRENNMRIKNGIGGDSNEASASVDQIRKGRVKGRTNLDQVELYLWYLLVLLSVVSIFHKALQQDWGLTMMAILTLSMFLFVSLFSRLTRKRVPPLFRYFFILLTAGGIAFSCVLRDWDITVNGLLTIVLLSLPIWMARRKLILIPSLFQIVVLVYILASMYFGEVLSFYYHFSWWDDIVHLTSAPFIGYAGFLMVYIINKDQQIHHRFSPFFLALFAFSFSLVVGVAWEIFEFGVDVSLGVNMQKARNLELVYGYFDTRLGLMDTMQDLVVDAFGALIVSMIGYRYLKKDSAKAASFWRLKDQFIEDNPQLFD